MGVDRKIGRLVGRNNSTKRFYHICLREKCYQMIDFLANFMIDIPDNWCDKYYHDGEYHQLSEPLWGIKSSAVGGRFIHEVVPLRANHPYGNLWRDHYMSITKQMGVLGLNDYDIDTSDTILRKIEILASRNKYPAHSLAHIYVWREISASGGVADYAIFQEKRETSIFETDSTRRIIVNAAEHEVINLAAGEWSDTIVEQVAHQRAMDRERREMIGIAGACLLRPDRRIARTTIGNIYFISSGKIIGVSDGEGARRCILRPHLRDIAKSLRLNYEEVDGITPPIITNAVECFICDASIGIGRVLRLGEAKTFIQKLVPELSAKLSERFIF